MESLKKPVIAICLAKLQWEPQGSIVRAICHEAELNNYYVQIFNMNDDMFDGVFSENGEKAVLDLITYERLCALVVMSETIKDRSVVDELIQRTAKHKIPVISVDRSHDEAYNVVFDWEAAFEEIVRHVVEVHNCRNINFLAGIKNNYFSDKREQIFKDVLDSYGIHVKHDQIGYGGFWEWPARQAVEGFLENNKKPPEAIICANDLMAVTAIDVLSEHGYSVPEDVIVTGFDMMELGQYYTPRLTTAAYKFKEIGQNIMKVASIFLSGKKLANEQEVVGYTCHYRESCGCAKRDYIRANKALLSIYGQYSKNLDHMDVMCTMLEQLTQYRRVADIADHLHRFMYDIKYTELKICVCEEFLQHEHTVLDKESFLLDNMVEWIDVQFEKQYKTIMQPFHFREQLAQMQSMYDRENQIMFSPLHANDKMFGYAAVSYNWDHANRHRFYEFVMNLGVILSVVRKKEDEDIKREQLENNLS